MSNRHRDRASTQEQAAESKAVASPSEATFSAESAAAVTLNENGKYCPGHVDLTITVKTTGLKEKHNLFALDGTGNQAVGNWQGWTEEKQTAAQTLAAQDWQGMYGLASSEFALGNPLTPAEIASYLDLLPEDLSPSGVPLSHARSIPLARFHIIMEENRVQQDFPAIILPA